MKILDNITNTVRDDLRVEIKKGSRVSIAAACFSMYAYKELKKQLETIDEFEFIFTSPTFVKEKGEKQKREFYIPRISRETSLYGTEFEIKLRNEMTQRAIAKECADWIRRKATFKSNTTGENICEIGKERIRRAGKQILSAGGGQLSFSETQPDQSAPIDIGFRCLRLDSSNMENVYYTPEETQQQDLFSLVDNVKPDRTPEDLLFQVMLDLGVLLSSPIEVKEIAGKKVFNVADGFLLACFDHDVTEETVKAIAQMKPYYAVFRDSSMANDSVATNFDQIFETYSPETVRKVL